MNNTATTKMVGGDHTIRKVQDSKKILDVWFELIEICSKIGFKNWILIRGLQDIKQELCMSPKNRKATTKQNRL